MTPNLFSFIFLFKTFVDWRHQLCLSVDISSNFDNGPQGGDGREQVLPILVVYPTEFDMENE